MTKSSTSAGKSAPQTSGGKHSARARATRRASAPQYSQQGETLASAPANPLDVLQRTYGNQALGRVANPPLTIQPSLMLGAVDTPAEREADAVVSSLARPIATQGASLQRAPVGGASAGAVPIGSAAMGAGMDVAPDVAQRIKNARDGMRLDPTLQRTMEGHIGADFSAVRIHTGSRADGLNRDLQAKAFTTGSDVFFRDGAYRPNDEGGKRLIAHELTHVVQQRGAQQGAASRSGVQRKGIIQRAVGFEFEAGSWELRKLNAPLTKQQKKGQAQVPATQQVKMGIPKGASLYKGKDWDFTADHSDDMHVEFVTKSPGFQEGKAGRKKLVEAMKEMKKFGDKMMNKDAPINVAGGKKSYQLRDITSKGAKNVLVSPAIALLAEPQTTAGIRMSQLASMFENFAKAAKPGETKAETDKRGVSNSLLWGKKAKDQATMAGGPDAVRTAHGELATKYAGVTKSGVTGMPALSDITIGLVSMMRSYLVTAAGSIAYAKSLAPLMARTNYVTMFNILPDEERDYYTKEPKVFGELVLKSAGMLAQADDPVISGKTDYIPQNALDLLQEITKWDWIKGITEGKDYLTTEDFPYEGVDQLLFGLGGLGSKTDEVNPDKKGKAQQYAPIFEFRRMQGGMPHTAWPSLAADVFDFISKVNQGTGEAFDASDTIDSLA